METKAIASRFDDFKNLFDAKAAELREAIETIKVKDSISKNTRGVQLYAKKREYETLQLIRAMFAQYGGVTLEEPLHNRLVSLVTLSEERNGAVVKVQSGDRIVDLLAKYADVKDVYNKIMKAADKAGLTYDPSTGVLN